MRWCDIHRVLILCRFTVMNICCQVDHPIFAETQKNSAIVLKSLREQGIIAKDCNLITTQPYRPSSFILPFSGIYTNLAGMAEAKK
jgi:hypothetical protein